MEDEILRLKWNGQKNTFFDILRVQREKSNYTDATLAVEGKFYPVHKLVMGICSDYFSDIFQRISCKSPVIVLKDVRIQDIEALLDYMYLGEVNVNQNDLQSLLKTAKCLRIKGLAGPDEDPVRTRKKTNSSHVDTRQDSPPPKRRRHVSNTILSGAASPVPTTQKSASTSVSTSILPHPTSNSSTIEQDELPFVKVETIDIEDQEEVFKMESDFEGDFNTEHDLVNKEHTSFPGSSSLKQSFSSNSEQNEPVDVKVEIDNAEELKERFGLENDYVRGASSDYDTGENYETASSKNEHEPINYESASFSGLAHLHQTEFSPHSISRKSRKRSHVWDFFTHPKDADGKEDKTIVQCSECDYTGKYSSSTSNMAGHLKNVHYHLLQANRMSSTNSASCFSMPTVSQMFERQTHWPYDRKTSNLMKNQEIYRGETL